MSHGFQKKLWRPNSNGQDQVARLDGRIAEPRQLVRRIVVSGNPSFITQPYWAIPPVIKERNGGVITQDTTTILWADGSELQPDGTYTWADHTTGHADPENPKMDFGASAMGYFIYNNNLFVYGNLWGNFGTPDSIDTTQRISFLDAAQNVLAYVEMAAPIPNTGEYESCVYTWDGNIFPKFNAIKVKIITDLPNVNCSVSAEAWVQWFLGMPAYA